MRLRGLEILFELISITETFIKDPTASPLALSRFHQAWGFVILGLPIAALGLEIICYQFIKPSSATITQRST